MEVHRRGIGLLHAQFRELGWNVGGRGNILERGVDRFHQLYWKDHQPDQRRRQFLRVDRVDRLRYVLGSDHGVHHGEDHSLDRLRQWR